VNCLDTPIRFLPNDVIKHQDYSIFYSRLPPAACAEVSCLSSPVLENSRISCRRPYVCFWLKADLLRLPWGCPLYPRKRTFFSTGVYVCF